MLKKNWLWIKNNLIAVYESQTFLQGKSEKPNII